MNNFNEETVSLTPEERQQIVDDMRKKNDAATSAAIEEAEEKKKQAAKTKAYWEKVSKQTYEVKLSAEQFQIKILNRGCEVYGVDSEGKSKMKIDDFNRDIFVNLFKYFHGMKGELDLDKGILLLGNVGAGKSKLMQLFKYNQKCSYTVKSARELADDYSHKENGGASFLKRYSGMIPNKRIDLTFGQSFIGLCIDDVGTEENSMHMGNRINVIENLILNRYDKQDEEDQPLKGKTHITTNLTLAEMEERYGHRVRSRLSEMFNLVVMPVETPDRRRV